MVISSFFPKVTLNHRLVKGGQVPVTPYRVFVGHVTIIQFKPYAISEIQLFTKKIGNGWKLLLHRTLS